MNNSETFLRRQMGNLFAIPVKTENYNKKASANFKNIRDSSPHLLYPINHFNLVRQSIIRGSVYARLIFKISILINII